DGIAVRTDDADSPLDRSLIYTNELKLKHFQNSFVIDFSIFDYSADNSTKYTYRLDNYDKEWSVPSSLNFAAYKNLSPGSYLLRVKACNRVGHWNDEEAVLKIVIVPPFWKTTWAFLIYALLIGAILYFAFRLMQKFNTLRNRIAVEKQLTEYKLVFFTNISHEFRTPLTLIQGALEKIQRRGKVPKEMTDSVKVMEKSTNRLLRLINQLLEFRKMQNNKLALSLEQTDVVAFLYEIFLSFNDAAESQRMNFKFLPSKPSYKMYIDKGYLDKITYNLLSNAFKYTPNGGTVCFSVEVNETSKQLIITVSDTGVGIPKEKQHELFKRFMQSSFSGSSVGVGLHLTHELVNVHKGTITFRENEGGGSIFTVTLPTDTSLYEEKDVLVVHNALLQKEELATPPSTEENSEEEEAELVLPAEPLNTRKVLIIEDDNDVRAMLKEEVGQYFEVETASDGLSGLERARTYDADLIICDVLMPGMTGFEVTSKLKNDFDTSHIPIILLTAMSSPESHLNAVESGADSFITKPFSLKLLLTRAFKLIEQRDKLREKFSHDPNMMRPAICTSDKDKEFADKLQRIMEQQIGNAEFTIDEFASMMGLGRTVFYRKTRGVTGYAPNEYIRIVRMKKAAELLRENRYKVAEVSYQVGINDPFYFSKCFKRQFGVSPSAYVRGREEGDETPTEGIEE
ncbi:MAG: response regulator, partial [Alistipes sp.]|nr:response regulator [Alistipes sp.]